MLARRLLFLVAALVGLMLVAASVSPRTDPVPPATAPGAGTGGAAAMTDVVERTVDLGAEEPQTVAVDEGDNVRLVVTGGATDVVELAGLDLFAPVSPETPAIFDVLADRPGEYPLVLTQARRTAGTLDVMATP